MSQFTDFLVKRDNETFTLPAYTINIQGESPQYLKEQMVLVDGVIQEKRPSDGTPELFVTAGLINCHMHWVMTGDATPFPVMLETIAADPAKKIEEAIAHAQDTLRMGVTFGWDKGPPGINGLPIYAGMRTAEKKGVLMTRFIHCPWAVMKEGGFGAPFGRVLSIESEIDIILMETAASGAKAIKFIPETVLKASDKSYGFLFSDSFFKETREKAAKKGLLTAVHAKGVNSLDKCIAVGVDCIEHAIQATDEQLRAFQEKNIFIGPTLFGLECRLDLARKTKGSDEIAAYEYEAVCNLIERASRLNNGQPFTHMLFSSDAGSFTTPHASIRELYLMRKSGYSAAAVFKAATVNGALCTRQADKGTLDTGKQADLVYWKKNPLELSLDEWEHLENYIAAVVLEGKLAYIT